MDTQRRIKADAGQAHTERADALRAYETVSDLYPSPWLCAADLGGKRIRVTIERVDVEAIRQRDGGTAPRAVLTFQRARKRMILNRTQCEALVALTGSERLADWVGHDILLSPGTAPNGKPTIVIERIE